MISLKRAAYQDHLRVARFVGLSTDTKPLKGNAYYENPRNGDEFREMDTNTTFYYDEENDTWV